MSGITGGSILEPAYTTDMQGGTNTVSSVAAGTTSTSITFNAPSGGKAPYAYSVTTSGGTLSNSNSLTMTLSGMVNGGQYVVTCVSLDANTGVAQQRTIQSRTVIVGEGTPVMEANTVSSLPVGTTSKVFTFAEATGGKAPYAYACSLIDGSPGSLSVNGDGRSGTISGMTDGDEYGVQCTVTDNAGRPASAVQAYGIGVTPGATFAEWSVVETIDFTAYSGSYTSTATIDGRVYTISTNGTPGTKTMAFDATNGMSLVIGTGGTGNSATVSVPLNHSNFRRGETFIVEFLMKVNTIANTAGAIVGVANNTSVSTNSHLGIRLVGTGANAGEFLLRKYTASTTTESPSALTTFVTTNEWYSVQLIINEGSILYGALSKSSSFLNGFSFSSGNIGAGTWSGYLGGIAKNIGAVPAGPFESSLKFNITTAAGTHTTYVKAMQVLRATRPRQG